jgi:peptidoglycan/LPS O-acetylase OafA/YrhL
MTALDGLRGAAALRVVLSHCMSLGFLPQVAPFGGVLGVTIFFALSGFLMASLHGRQEFNSETVWTYIVPRGARIAPLYLLVVIIAWLIHARIDNAFVYNINADNITRHLFFSGSEQVFWTIPPEVQFYAFFLLIWVALARRGKYAAALGVSIVGMLLVAHRLPGTTLPAKLPFFLFGACAGLVRVRFPERFVSTIQAILLLSVTAASAILFHIAGQEAPVYQSFLYAALCALMILSFSLPARFGLLLFGNRVMLALGAWSFSIYLLHEPALYWGRTIQSAASLPAWSALLLGLTLTISISAAAHYLIERPAQQKLRLLGKSVSHITNFRKLAIAPRDQC